MPSSIALPDLSALPPLYEVGLAALFGMLATVPLQMIAARFDVSAPLVPLGLAATLCSVISYALPGGGLDGMTLLITALLLLIASWIDLAVLRLPNLLVIALLLLGIGRSALGVGPDMINALAGAAIGLGLMGLTGAIYKLVRRQSGLGMGDIKIAAALGLLVGAQGILLVLLVASVLQALIGVATLAFGSGRIRQEQPFGPALALASWLLLLVQV